MIDTSSLLIYLGTLDPSPFFVISLIPYLLFIYWGGKTTDIPKLSLLGFKLTILFVLMTIIFAVFAKLQFGAELTDVDKLHGAAEAFLTLSDAFVALGFLRLWQDQLVKNS